MLNIDIDQAKLILPDLIEKSLKGGEIIITKNGLPVVKLVSIPKPKRQRQSGTAKGLIKISEDFDKPLDDFREYS